MSLLNSIAKLFKIRSIATKGIKMNILLVDDEACILELLKEFIEQKGHIVQTAKDGHEGVCKVREAQSAGREFDILITDLNMPVYDGYAFSKEARRVTKAPILLHTSEYKPAKTDDINMVVDKMDTKLLLNYIEKEALKKEGMKNEKVIS